MKKIIIIALTLTICLIITACGRTSDNDYDDTNAAEPVAAIPATPPPPPHQGMLPAPPAPVPQDAIPDEPLPDLFPPSGYYFTLTAEEQAAYERLKAELSTDVFYGLSPISVAKIYIQAGIDGEWEAEFAAYNPDSLERTREEFYESHRIDIERFDIASRRSLANWAFPFIDDAEVIIDGDRALLIFLSVPDPELGPDAEGDIQFLNLIRNDAGIWEMRFRPHAME